MKTQPTTGERTLVLFKPSEALRRVGPIRSQLSKCGLIVEARMISLTVEAVEMLAISLHPSLKQALVTHCANQTLPVIVLEGEGVIHRVSHMVGTVENPELCSESSIRHIMWQEFGCRVQTVKGGHYYNNFLMCSRTSEEAELYIRTLINPNLVSFKF